jgi:hypothetical protein
MLPEHCDAHLRLRADITRLARCGYIAAPALPDCSELRLGAITI